MLRFLVPNAITSLSIAFAVLGIQAAASGRFRDGAWWLVYCVLTDKVDGVAARALKASSPFGMQLDSLADLVAFGVAPATLVYAFFSTHAGAGWTEGWRTVALAGIAVGYVICTALRLARFNVISDVPGAERVFFGTPSTFAGGTLVALFATLLKYGDPAWGEWSARDVRLLGGLRLDVAMPLLPWFVAVAAVAMVSNLRVPKIGRTRSRLVNATLLVWLAVCYGVGFARLLPEFLAASAVTAFGVAVGYHLLSGAGRGAKPPWLFPRA
ncbi:MAG: hypothetical protein EXR72_08165 [Myxococcales bacterium]|nr:hypothetical protein [Myxococcales bacterium]